MSKVTVDAELLREAAEMLTTPTHLVSSQEIESVATRLREEANAPASEWVVEGVDRRAARSFADFLRPLHQLNEYAMHQLEIEFEAHRKRYSANAPAESRQPDDGFCAMDRLNDSADQVVT